MKSHRVEAAKTFLAIVGMAACGCGLLLIAAIASSDAFGLHLFQ